MGIIGNQGAAASGGGGDSVRTALPHGHDIFGSGRFIPYRGDANFVVPYEVELIRVRVVAAGGGASAESSSDGVPCTDGGGGGGFAIGEFEVLPGEIYAITVGKKGVRDRYAPTDGGASSFGALISAMGGKAGSLYSADIPGVGGIGVGGYFQASGGSGGGQYSSGDLRYGGGGGAAGSSMGDGGDGGFIDASSGYGPAGGGVGGGDALGSVRGSPYGPGAKLTPTLDDATSLYAPRFPFDRFTGGPSGMGAEGGYQTNSGSYSHGGDGGGAGGSMTNSTSTPRPAGNAGIGGGAGGQSFYGSGGLAGDGIVVVEW